MEWPRPSAASRAGCTATKRGIDVRFAIHPVGTNARHERAAGEAETPYDAHEMDGWSWTPELPQTDVALVVAPTTP